MHSLFIQLLAWLWPAPAALFTIAPLTFLLRPFRKVARAFAVLSAAAAVILLAAALAISVSSRGPSPSTNLPLSIVLFALLPLVSSLLLLARSRLPR